MAEVGAAGLPMFANIPPGWLEGAAALAESVAVDFGAFKLKRLPDDAGVDVAGAAEDDGVVSEPKAVF